MPASSPQPTGGGWKAAVRDSTNSDAASASSGSSSPAGGAKPTDVTCVPGATQSRRITGVPECVQRATTSAPRTAAS